MKWFTNGSFTAFLLSNLLVSAVKVPAHHLYNTHEIQDELVENFREPKNIMFASSFGGSSHATWVLSILDELYHRGHNITYVSTNLHAKFAKPYPYFNTVVLEKERSVLGKSVDGKHVPIGDIIEELLDYANQEFGNDYATFKNIMVNRSMDIAICDYGAASGCSEAAKDTKTPYIVTAAFGMISDASAPYINNNVLSMREPTTINMTLMERFNDRIITPIKLAIKMGPKVKQIIRQYREAGCSVDKLELDPSAHQNALKLINSLYGIEAARPMGPLVELVGPIVPRKYNPLTPELKTFLDTHKRVLYIAFGQHASSTSKDLEMILIAIMESIEAGAYDGFLWASRDLNDRFPKKIMTQSGRIYNVADMFAGLQPNAHFIQWAPQTAVVMHPSVSVFLTHGGAGSLYEALYAGKRLIVFPFFADQFPNAKNVEHNQIGGFLNPENTQEEANELLQRIGYDVDGTYQKNANRYKALVQIHSKHGIIRAADLVEEVLFVNKDGLLPYRYEVSRQMSFIKAHNIDIYALAAFIVLAPIVLFGVIMKKLFFKKTTSLIDKQKLN
ncbi:uncharacterized protein BX663DRAFT_469250 [Cokeromyces recurvatus]|uniref:uncharacterized protein n=1 Tax=Cokeromyces recurvatus TaxID=90255 RepID=UPI00221EF2B2|nr:uncharacterized protein BX663DRAFT_469250 [Cokeromyces recurvatus]KAI7905328.1 hypothetical protein BX663DRAFT_469250 [Cokeromyces recurvatus]